MSLLERFKQYIQKENLFQPDDRLLVAVSGGVDSVSLCELCKQAGYHFVIAHCNFQLREEFSKRDEDFVKALAQKYEVPFFVKTFETTDYATANKKSIEEAARDLRYEWFYSLVNSNNKETEVPNESVSEGISLQVAKFIVTAHHADDNIETVTMNFFRGTGISGIRGILPKQGKILRPLLFARRRELEEFVKDNDLEFVTDHTNLLEDYTRNYFRNTIIPLVNESYPGASGNILNNIRRFRETEILYQQAILLHKKKLIEQKGSEVHLPVLKLKRTVPLATVLFEIMKEYNFTAHQTDEAIALMDSATGRFIQSASHRMIKNRNWLIISPVQTIESNHILIQEKDQNIEFENGTISILKIPAEKFSMVNNPLASQLNLEQIKFPLLLRKWKQGDYFYPLGMQKKKKLSRFFIDQKLSLIQKEKTWVIEMDKRIIWIVGMRIDDRFKITSLAKNILKLDYRPK
ncbi:MAG: tRNA(Ile)-lysidine synthase [Ferruginibacter sp.]|nr:tRNA(Ile)-lysidine synthase [Ferruginibacter sp.]